jgi:hypothetical protein
MYAAARARKSLKIRARCKEYGSFKGKDYRLAV